MTQQPPCADSQQIKVQIFRSLAQSQLHRLQEMLQLRGWYTRYEPGGIGPPRLFAWHPVFGELGEAICVAYRHIGNANPVWFRWASGGLICRAKDMQCVARLIEPYGRRRALSARLARDAVELPRAPGGAASEERALPAVLDAGPAPYTPR